MLQRRRMRMYSTDSNEIKAAMKRKIFEDVRSAMEDVSSQSLNDG